MEVTPHRAKQLGKDDMVTKTFLKARNVCSFIHNPLTKKRNKSIFPYSCLQLPVHSFCFTRHLLLSSSVPPLKNVMFCRAHETLPQLLRDSLGCKDCCTNTNILTYLLASSLSSMQYISSYFSFISHHI